MIFNSILIVCLSFIMSCDNELSNNSISKINISSKENIQSTSIKTETEEFKNNKECINLRLELYRVIFKEEDYKTLYSYYFDNKDISSLKLISYQDRYDRYCSEQLGQFQPYIKKMAKSSLRDVCISIEKEIPSKEARKDLFKSCMKSFPSPKNPEYKVCEAVLMCKRLEMT